MNWQERIVSDPDTLFCKPRIGGTRIGVEFILDLMASGWDEAQILESYPHLTWKICGRYSHLFETV